MGSTLAHVGQAPYPLGASTSPQVGNFRTPDNAQSFHEDSEVKTTANGSKS